MTPQSHVLLVDDNEMNRDALSRRLIQKGYRVTVAAGGPEALALAAEASHDIVLLDVEMPGMSGLEVLTTLRESRSQTQLPIIMVTARTQEADIVEAFRLGANDYVTKPIDFPVALARIETHLSHKRAVEALRESEERYALASSGANDGLWDWNLATDCVFWSARWKAMLGHDADDIGVSPEEWFSRVHHEDLARVRASLTEHLRDGSGHYESEHRILHRDGSYRYMLCRGAAVRGADGTATRLAGSLTDVTERKVADPLTGLPNRLLFVEVLDRAIKRTERRPDYMFALLILGLDRFKSVNATCGLLTADRLLVAVARRLQSSLRATDAITRDRHEITLARLGSDEFTVLLDDIVDAGDAMHVAERLRTALEEPFDVGGQQIFTSATVGIAVSATGYETPEEILRDAAIALHRAKAHGAARVELFDPAMRDRAVTRLRIETELRSAIENRELAVYYQPIISLVSGEISAFEALVRWHHPERGLIGPDEFIPVAEETGMILQIARLTLLESCRQMVAWQCQFGAGAPALMCVNVSSRQFKDSNLAIETEAVLRQTGLTPSSLKLEITESAFIDDVQAAQLTLSALQDLGVAWSLDDFGTGYSSLSYLHRLRVNTVKADRSFVSRIGEEAEGPEMVRAIVAMAHNLGMDVIAEGVETANQLTQLRALGCDHVQGFLFSRAVDAVSAGALIGSRPWQHYATSVLSAPLDVVLSY